MAGALTRMLGRPPTGVVRGATSAFVNLTNTCNVPLPPGTQPSDGAVLYIGHSWSGSPGTWSGTHFNRNSITGSNYSGAVYSGLVDATDIARGYLTVGFSGNGYGIVQLVTFVGQLGGYRDIGATRTSTGAASRTVSTPATIVAGDHLLLFGSAWTATAASSSSLPTTLVADPHSNASGVCVYGVAGSSGVQSGTVNYAGSPGGDYQAMVAIAP